MFGHQLNNPSALNNLSPQKNMISVWHLEQEDRKTHTIKSRIYKQPEQQISFLTSLIRSGCSIFTENKKKQLQNLH